jgi:hypothetical protein
MLSYFFVDKGAFIHQEQNDEFDKALCGRSKLSASLLSFWA